MSLTNRNSGTLFFTLSAYNWFRSRTSRRSDSSISDAETNRNSETLFFTLSAYNRFCSRTSQRSDSSISDAESIQSSQAQEQGSTGDRLPTQHTEGEILSSHNLKAFTFNELKSATRNFHPTCLIGDGGFGYVFKGWIDEQTFTASEPGVGMVVAVKKLKPEGFQGRNEWLAEVHYLGQLHHPNLVKLIGFCSDGNNRLLVYEFMPRESLENHLFGRGAESLSWATRIKAAIGAAKGLAFLHDTKSQAFYGDVNSSNILLDSDFNAKLSYFGDMRDVTRNGGGLVVADELDLGISWENKEIRASCPSDLWNRTNVPTRVMSTLGYASAREADVYSFGVVLLELLSGRKAYERFVTEQNLVDWAKPYPGDERIMDPKLEGQCSITVAHAMANLVSVCIGNDPKLRPRMSEVSAVLEKLQDPRSKTMRLENLSKLKVQNF